MGAPSRTPAEDCFLAMGAPSRTPAEGSVKGLFARESNTGYLLVGLATLSVLLVFIEANTRLLVPVRSAIGTVAAPVYLLANVPTNIWKAGDWTVDIVADRVGMRERITDLEKQVADLTAVSQQFLAMREENNRLRELLGSSARVPGQKLIAELVAVVPDMQKHRVVINKGTADGVAVGAAVIDPRGLFGQVIETARMTSVVLLITDTTHAVPAEVGRNNIRVIAAGWGEYHLRLEAVPKSLDIREGDVLYSSGLGGRFPKGYPVGTVIDVEKLRTARFAGIRVRPAAALDRSRYVLVVSQPAVGEVE